MIRLMRKIPSNYYGLLTVLVGLGAGLGMIEPDRGGKTWLCFDGGCITTQGYTVLTISIVSGVWLVVLEVRRLRRINRRRHAR